MAKSDDGLRVSGYWRDRAEESRTMADGMANAAAKELMLEIARGYDRTADLAAEREAQKKTTST